MYKKPFAVQQQNLLSKKDLKGLKVQLAEQYPALDPKVIDALLPDGQVKLLKLVDSRCVLYVTGEQTPLFFDPEGRSDFFPTLHTLWLHPNMMPELTIHAQVSKFVLNGADLMLPGLIVPANGVAGFGSVSKGQKRCITCEGNPYPIAVGKMLVNQSQMEKLKGKGLEVLHVFKDTLWEFSGKAFPNAGFSEKEDEITSCGDASYVPGEAPAAAKSADELPPAAAEKTCAEAAKGTESSPIAASVDGGASPTGDAAKVSAPGGARAAEDWSQDDLCDFCFLQAFRVSIPDDKLLPIEASELYEKHMKPSRPEGTTLDVKKSSHKQIGKFLNSLRKAKVIEVTDKKGVISVTKVVRDHKFLAQLEGKFADASAVSAELTVGNASAATSSTGLPPPLVTSMWKLKSDVKGLEELFKIMGKNKNDFHSWEVSRGVLLDYIKKEGLGDGSGDDFNVKLNEALTLALYRTAGGQKKDLTFPDAVSFRELEEIMQSRMQEHTTIEVAGLPPVTRKGPSEHWLIEVSLSRKGAHNVTKVCNLEAYGLDVPTLGDELKKKLNCNVNIEPMPGKNSKDNCMTLQGHADKELSEFLQQKYGITKAFMSVKQ